MPQDALGRAIRSPRSYPQRGPIHGDIMAYAANPQFANTDSWIIEDNPYRRPIRPQDLDACDFATPLDKQAFCSGSALAAQRMLINIYESDAMYLPDAGFSSIINEFRQFYSAESRRAGESIRPTLERHTFGFLDREIDTSGNGRSTTWRRSSTGG